MIQTSRMLSGPSTPQEGRAWGAGLWPYMQVEPPGLAYAQTFPGAHCTLTLEDTPLFLGHTKCLGASTRLPDSRTAWGSGEQGREKMLTQT